MSEILGEAVVIVRPDTTGFAAALEAEIAAVTRTPVVVPVELAPVGAGVGAATTELTALSTSAEAAGVANSRAAVGAVEHARALGQLERGAAASTLTLFGLRGATLAASGAFLAGTAAVIALKQGLTEASDTTEELNKTTVVFGASSKQIIDFAKTSATALGISNVQALRAAGIFGNLFRVIHISAPESADMSQRLVQLASDLASFNNADPSRVLEALRSGLVGQARPLRVFGIFISQARAQQEALIETGKKNVKELTNSELVQARYNIILKDSRVAQGDFARTSDRMANQIRILRAQVANLEGELGALVLGPMTGLIRVVNLDVTALGKLTTNLTTAAGAAKGLGDKLVGLVPGGGGALSFIGDFAGKAARLGFLIPGVGVQIGAVNLLIDHFSHSSQGATFTSKQLADALLELGSAAGTAGSQLETSVQRVEQLNQAQRGAKILTLQQLQIQTGLAPGGRQAEEANLRAQIANDKRLIGLVKTTFADRQKALEDLKQAQDQLTALQQQDAQDAQAQAQKVKDAAQKAAQARARADQAVIDSFAGPDAALANRQARAAATASVADDLAVNRALIAQTKAEIAAVRTRVKDAQTRNNELRALTSQLVAAELEHNRLLREQAAAQAARVTEARDRALEIARLNVQIAEAAGQPAAEKRALNAEIAALKLRIKQVRGNNVLVKQLTLELVQAQQKLKDLGKAAQDTHTFAQEAFGFLQTETGFTSNLIGNLIPGGATGLVGGTAGGAPAAAKIPLPSREPPTPAGPTRGQGQTTNHLLSQAVALLRQIYLGQGHPEASRQHRNGNAVMDTNVVSRGM